MENMEEKQMNPAESLMIINTMINTAKNKLADDGFMLIFWGWLVFSASLIHYICIIGEISYGYLVWPVLMPLGGVVSILYGYKLSKRETVKTYIDVYLSYLWGAFGIGLFITLLFMQIHGIKITYFFLMLLYGIATLVSGGLLSFKPLVYGSLFSFAFACLSIFVGEKEQLLCIAAALLASYIIPGHLLRTQYKSQTHV
jgi:hypothetical protein